MMFFHKWDLDPEFSNYAGYETSVKHTMQNNVAGMIFKEFPVKSRIVDGREFLFIELLAVDFEVWETFKKNLKEYLETNPKNRSENMDLIMVGKMIQNLQDGMIKPNHGMVPKI